MSIGNRKIKTALFIITLMILTPLAGAINVTTFSDGASETEIEIRDARDWTNTEDGSIQIPATDTVTGATMSIGTDMAEHQANVRIDVDTMPRVWNPLYNGQLTQFSSKGDFKFEEGTTSTAVELTSNGILSDFEGTRGGFQDATIPLPQNGQGWSHGALSGGGVISTNCKSGDDCWGTNLQDDDYTDDHGGAILWSMTSPALFVDPTYTSKKAYFDSWHSLQTITTGGQTPQYRYVDCAYLEIRDSNDPNFPPDASNFDYIRFDVTNSTNIGFGNGIYQRSSGTTQNQIDYRCDGVPSSAPTGQPVPVGLGGTSANPNNPNGWTNLAVDLDPYLGKYVQLRFVMEYNNVQGQYTNDSTPGWVIDNFRLGDKLPPTGWMKVRNMLPSVAGGETHPNGYGVLNLEAEIPTEDSLTVDVLSTQTGQIVKDIHGNEMTGLTGKIIELWDINSADYTAIDFKFNFDSGTDRLSTPKLHGFNIGTTIGTGFNETDLTNPDVYDGIWHSPGLNIPFFYNPTIVDTDSTDSHPRNKFSYPITAITPRVNDDCPSEDPSIGVAFPGNEQIMNLTVGVENVLSEPVFGFSSIISYQNSCNMGELWFDLKFGHHAKRVTVDIAGDGDTDWGIDHPAFDALGRQTYFYQNYLDGVYRGQETSSIVVGISGSGEGGQFLLPRGANVTLADIAFDNNTIYSTTDQMIGFDLSILAGTQSVALGAMDNRTTYYNEDLPMAIDYASAINSLMNNPMVPAAVIDEYGTEWVAFRFAVDSPNATTGASIDLRGLDLIYDWETSIGDAEGFDTELNQGVALWTGGSSATVDIVVSSRSGGSVAFSDLSISTSPGYDSTMEILGNPVGLYPNGDIYQITTTHSVASSTGSSFAEAKLVFESASGNAELGYSDLLGFSEVSDTLNLVTLETSTAADITTPVVGKEITWRFRVNPTWDDTDAVRVYGSLVAANGVNGLPDAFTFDPQVGNAVENDAGITELVLRNDNNIIQNLSNASSNNKFNLQGKVRLQDLDASPDPAGYYLVLEQQYVNNTDGNITLEWIEIDNKSGTIGGDFNWDVDLGLGAAGTEIMRVRLGGYEGGDTLCPPSELTPDEDCAIPFTLHIDAYAPNLLNMEVHKGGPDIPENWRTLYDDTWVVPNDDQWLRINAQDLPNPPAEMTLNMWVEYEHDSNNNGIAEASEYAQVTVYSDGGAPNATYEINFNDEANQGQDPIGRVSLWLDGYDLAGNSIDGGSAGFENDHVTYVSMSSRMPEVLNFHIEDSSGTRMLNSGDPGYEGDQNRTIFAGNEYSLIVEASELNGYRDLDFFKINLDGSNAEEMVLYYSPRNETAWTDSEFVSIITDGEGPRMLRMDGGAIIDPFESEFYLDLPVAFDWGVPDLLGLNTPTISVKDFDNVEQSFFGFTGHLQDWKYDDQVRLDFQANLLEGQLFSPTITDMTNPITADTQVGFVRPGDTIAFEGQYAFVTALQNGAAILPEVELTMEITRQEALQTGNFIPYVGETWTETFSGGSFAFNITAPPVTNKFHYTFRLINLPDGASDNTDSYCQGYDAYGCGQFDLLVDFTIPEVVRGTWELTNNATGEVLGANMPSTAIHCVDVYVELDEPEKLLTEEVELRWQMFVDPQTSASWGPYNTAFDGEPLSSELTLQKIVGSYIGTANCVDLWPDPVDPDWKTLSAAVDLIFWIHGTDSAGNIIRGGGPTGEGSVVPIQSSDDEHTSEYRLEYEEALFRVDDYVRWSPTNPTVGESLTITLEVENYGSIAGPLTMRVESVTDGGIPVFETTFTTDEIAPGESTFANVELQAYGSSTTGLYYLIFDDNTDSLLYNGSARGDLINVNIQANDNSGNILLIMIGLIAVVAILGVLVIVLVRRDSSGSDSFDDEYEEYDDTKSVVDIPSNAPSTPPANLDPEMVRALEVFPQWTQEQIQEYFDMGWNVETLLEWVNEQ